MLTTASGRKRVIVLDEVRAHLSCLTWQVAL